MDLRALAMRVASLPPWDNLSEVVHFSNDIVSVVGKTSKSRQTGFEKEFTVLQSPDLVHVAALTNKGEIVLVRQFRHGVDRFTLELPGGSVNSGESPAEAAPRELAEETGFVSELWELLGSAFTHPSVCSNSVHMFLASGAVLTEGLPPDKGEEIEVVAVPVKEAVKMCHDGRILHPFSHSTIFAMLAKHPELSRL